MVHREKRIAEAMIKNAGGMSMNSSLLLACCFRKKAGGVSNLWCPKVPRPQGIQSNMITFWMLLVSRLWEVPFFFWQNFTATMALHLVAYAGMYSLLREWDKILDTIGLIANMNFHLVIKADDCDIYITAKYVTATFGLAETYQPSVVWQVRKSWSTRLVKVNALFNFNLSGREKFLELLRACKKCSCHHFMNYTDYTDLHSASLSELFLPHMLPVG